MEYIKLLENMVKIQRRLNAIYDGLIKVDIHSNSKRTETFCTLRRTDAKDRCRYSIEKDVFDLNYETIFLECEKLMKKRFKKIDTICVDIIDNKDIYYKKEQNIKVKSIISKKEVIDEFGITYLIDDLFMEI